MQQKENPLCQALALAALSERINEILSSLLVMHSIKQTHRARLAARVHRELVQASSGVQ